MKRYFIGILSCIGLISLLLNGVWINNYFDDKKQYDRYKDWSEYSVKLRLDKQSDIFMAYEEYLLGIIENTDTINDLSNYARAVFEFSSPEIVAGAINQREEEYKELNGLLQDILVAGTVVYSNIERVAEFDVDQLQQLRKICADLHYLLNSNNEEKSFTYYLQNNDFKSEASLNVQNQIKDNIEQLNDLFDSNYFR